MERPKNRVFVRNLDLTTSDNDFVSYFQTHYGGVIEGAKIIRDRNGRSKGYGFVSFIDRSIVNRVVSKRNHVIGGKKVVCSIASSNTKIQNISKNNETPQHLREIYVGNLDTDFTLRQLWDYFSYFGTIQNAYIVSDDQKRSLGFGFVEFENSSSIDTIQELRPHKINDREIQTLRVYPKNVPTYLKKPTNVLYVTNYDATVDEDDIEKYFSEFGDIILLSRKMQRPQDIKFVEIQFEDYDSVDVICLADNHKINGCTISVSKYLPNQFDKVQNLQTGNKDQNFHSSRSSSSNSYSTENDRRINSNPHPVITQQPSNSFFETRAVPTMIQGYESHSSQNQPQSNDEEEEGCCGGSSQRNDEDNAGYRRGSSRYEPETNENQDCIIL